MIRKLPINEILLGDSLEIMKTFPDKSIDWILTSVPYKNEDVPIEYYHWFSKVLTEFNRIIKHYSIIFNSSTRLIDICKKYNPERIMIWYKGILKYAYRYEPIFLFNHGTDLKINRRIWSDTFKFQPIYDQLVPYVNPLELYKGIIIMITRENDIILDPFLGSGTTAVACKELNRRFIGIEINENHYKKAKKSLESCYKSLDMFK